MPPFLISLLTKPFGALGMALAMIVLGFGLGEVFEHRGQMPFPASLLGHSLKVKLDRMEHDPKTGRDAWRATALWNRAVADQYLEAKKRCDGDQRTARDTQASNIDVVARRGLKSSGAAYDSGYGSGFIAGRVSCEDPHANPNAPAAVCGPVADPGGQHVSDDRSGWLGQAYTAPP